MRLIDAHLLSSFSRECSASSRKVLRRTRFPLHGAIISRQSENGKSAPLNQSCYTTRQTGTLISFQVDFRFVIASPSGSSVSDRHFEAYIYYSLCCLGCDSSHAEEYENSLSNSGGSQS